MSPSRVLAAAALLVAGAVIVSAPACLVASDRETSSECLKADDCESKLCVQGICIGRNGDACKSDQGCASGKCVGSKCAPYAFVPAEAGLDTGGGADTAPLDTGVADTGAGDTGKGDTAKSDADAHD